MEYADELRAAKKAVWRVVAEHSLFRRERTAIENEKSGHPLDTVTELDHKTEDKLVNLLSEEFDYGFLTEERDRDTGEGAYWCIDPIDGTTNFSRGFSPWGVSVALIENEQPVMGVVALLPEGRLFSAVKGCGAYVEENLDFSNAGNAPDYRDPLEGEKLEVSNTSVIGEAMIKTANNDKSQKYGSMVDFVRSLEEKGASLRNNGCATADLCSIAEGVLDGRANSNLERWDVDAARLVLSEAGGDYRMKRIKSGKLEFIASNGRLQDELESLWDKKTRQRAS